MSFLPTFVAGQTLAAVSSTLDNFLTVIPQGSIGGILVEATLHESHMSELEITEHPVEDGADITDHAYVRPVEVVMECGWSNSSPLLLNDLVNNVVNGLITGNPSSLFEDGSAPNTDNASSVFSQLVALQKQRIPFSIVTTLRSYDNMLIKSIRVNRDHRTINSLMAHVTCKQVLLVTTATGTLPPQANQLFPTTTADFSNLGPVQLVPNVSPSPLGSLPSTLWPSL